jgi:type IV pilus assembly protein PilC
MGLSEAIRAEGDLYPPVFAASLVAGERSGSLEVVLRRFVQYLRLNQALRRKAVSASVYPLFLIVMMVGVISVLVVHVLPQFQDFYSTLGAQLPASTRLVMAFAVGTRRNLWLILLALAAAAMTLFLWARREGSGAVIDSLLLKIPYIGRLMRMYATSQLSRTLSTLLGGGLPLLNALEVAAASIGNRAVAAAVSAATSHIREGRSLTVALDSTGIVDHLAIEMVKVGEQTGALGEMLAAVADFYDEELDTRIAVLLSLVEPVMLVLMAGIVAVVLLAFYLPLFQAISNVRT